MFSLSHSVMVRISPPITCLFISAPIAFRKKDKQEKDDIAQERIPQGLSWFGLMLNNTWIFVMVSLIETCLVCWWVYQMTRCPDTALKHRQLKTSWISIGTSRGPAQVMEPWAELLTTAQEVRKETPLHSWL